MKRNVLISLVVALALCVAGTYQVGYCEPPTPVTVRSTPSYFKFIGFSAVTTDGNGGQAAMNKLCKALKAKARMCTSQEVLASPVYPSSGAEPHVGWLNPTQVLVVDFSTAAAENMRYQAYDAVGVGYAYSSTPHVAFMNMNCNSWMTNSDDMSGLAFYGTSGNIANYRCNTELRVACCAP